MTRRRKLYSREQLLVRAGERLFAAQERCIKWFGTGSIRQQRAGEARDAAISDWNRAVDLPETRDDSGARLREIVSIIDGVENRCMAADGPVTPTTKEMSEAELTRIYQLAKGL